MNEDSTTVPPSTETPFTFLNLPRELRDEIYTHAALSSSFTFLRACRQLNEEGTPLLYKHGIYRMRALTLRSEHLPILSQRPPIHLIQSLYIAMPPKRSPIAQMFNYEIPRRAASLIEQFRGIEIRRKVCHFNLKAWSLSAGVAKGLGGLVGFEVVRVEMQISAIRELDDGKQERERCVRMIEKGLGSALGKAKWEETESEPCCPSDVFEKYRVRTKILAAEFRPWRSTLVN